MTEFTNLMIEKIKQVSSDWQKPWFSTQGINGYPENLEGRKYHGINALMLFWHMDKHEFQTPVYMTFNQAKKENIKVNKGEKSTSVMFWKLNISHMETGEKISANDYYNLPLDEAQKYKVVPILKHYNVFNISQTTFAEQYPERYAELQHKFRPELKDAAGMRSCPAIDNMLSDRKWVCPIDIAERDRAYYSLKEDHIHVPLKEQFVSGESFYATLLHEMTHSTGHSSRLDRVKKDKFGEKDYAREELVAELTAALVCRNLGISSSLREESAQYLKAWLDQLQENPKFMLSIMSDVNKASDFIENVVGEKTLAENLDVEFGKMLAGYQESGSTDVLEKLYRMIDDGYMPPIPEYARERIETARLEDMKLLKMSVRDMADNGVIAWSPDNGFMRREHKAALDAAQNRLAGSDFQYALRFPGLMGDAGVFIARAYRNHEDKFLTVLSAQKGNDSFVWQTAKQGSLFDDMKMPPQKEEPALVPANVVNLVTGKVETWQRTPEQLDMDLKMRNYPCCLPEYAVENSLEHKFNSLYRELPVEINPAISNIHIYDSTVWGKTIEAKVNGEDMPPQKVSLHDISKYLDVRHDSARDGYNSSRELASKYFPAESYHASFSFFSAVAEKDTGRLLEMKNSGFVPSDSLVKAMDKAGYITPDIRPAVSGLFGKEEKRSGTLDLSVL